MSGEPFFDSYLLMALVPAAFLIGSIPFGIIFTRRSGVDIRSTGSRNIGATNVLRSAGKKAAVLTLIFDTLKGALPPLLCTYIISNTMQGHSPLYSDLWLGLTGLSAVLGHMMSVFLSFRGGKGVATGFGFLLVYSPAVAGMVLILWLAVALAFRYSALAALIAVAAMPVLLFISGASSIRVIVGIVLAVLIIFRHKSNIRNILAGTESRIGERNEKT